MRVTSSGLLRLCVVVFPASHSIGDAAPPFRVQGVDMTGRRALGDAGFAATPRAAHGSTLKGRDAFGDPSPMCSAAALGATSISSSGQRGERPVGG